MTKKTITLFTILSFTLIGILGFAHQPKTLNFGAGTLNSQSNIRWIVTDDHRADALECYNLATTGKSKSYLGYVSSPNNDKLAAEGTLFTKTFCNSPMCTPSRSSMQSGRYPFRSGHYKFTSHQRADHVKPMVSQTFREYGYGTAVLGKTGWGIKNKGGDKAFYDHTIHFKRDLLTQGFGDFTPTMLAAAGIDVEAKEYDYLYGYDLAEVLINPEKKCEYILGEVNVVCGHRAYIRCDDFAFSMRTRDRWDFANSENINKDVQWALTCDRPKADMALYDLRNNPLEKVNLPTIHNIWN